MIGACFGFASVALGALGAHGLKKSSQAWTVSSHEREQRLDNWEVAARYQMYHALEKPGTVPIRTTAVKAWPGMVSAWARDMLSAGKVPFYSHKIENIASAGLAAHLGLLPAFEEIVISYASR